MKRMQHRYWIYGIVGLMGIIAVLAMIVRLCTADLRKANSRLHRQVQHTEEALDETRLQYRVSRILANTHDIQSFL
ncbi:hypothetical protein CSA56_04875 [candidate division KSB3 bacterium]|uniref:Uncharacterized protein n=1 Tax=candidate division KSB3 bacterium TaxID=2044937 RepID=A0A2G6KHZ2_9BACT|nr:MAG: hypothetical protein CSA56_04875 [candidate division KSB3 bacterium]